MFRFTDPMVFPLAFHYSSFAFSSSNTSIFSESIVWSPGKYRNCLIVWDRSSSIKGDRFCLSVYGRCFPPCKVCNRDTGIGENNWLVESGILKFAICDSTQGIRNPTSDWNQQSKYHWHPESRIHSVESRIQDFLVSPFMGRVVVGNVFIILPRSLMSYK